MTVEGQDQSDNASADDDASGNGPTDPPDSPEDSGTGATDAGNDAPAQPSPARKQRAKPKRGARASRAGRKATSNKSAKGKAKGRRRGTRPFPANNFEDALVLPDAIQKFGSGQRIRRLTLFDELGRSPDSSASRDLIYAASRYGLTRGNHQSEWLELTDEGHTATNPEASVRERTRARYELAIGGIDPFNALYVRYTNNKLPAQSVMRDHLIEEAHLDAAQASEAVETFIVNAKYVGVLKPVAGVERLLPLDHALDDLPAPPADLGPYPEPLRTRRAATGQPAVRDIDWSHTCFYITPIGQDGTDERNHADVFLSSIVEPAIDGLDRGLHVVRADHIEHPGLITAQVIEHVFRSALVIADLSFHNPNVFYELALRHASGKPAVLISRASDPLPFDVSDVRTVVFDTQDIWTFVPQMETWKAELAQQARRALEDTDGGANPLEMFFPGYREHLS